MFETIESEIPALLAGVAAINAKLKDSAYGVKAEVYKRDPNVLRLEVSLLVQDVKALTEGGRGLTTIFQVARLDIPTLLLTSEEPMDVLSTTIAQRIRSMSAHETEEWLHKAGLASDPHNGAPEQPLEPH